MSFYGASFIFDDTPSDFYNLKIIDFSESDPKESPIGGVTSIKEEWLYRRNKPYFYGRYHEESLEFDITVGSFSAIDGETRSAISRWLSGRNGYKTLKIVQDDIAVINFNVIFTELTMSYIGNISYAITLHAKCDRPWGIYIPPLTTKTYSSGSVSETFNYFNDSIYDGYNKPIITLTAADSISGSSGQITITNITDGNRKMSFTGLRASEYLNIDCDKGIITSSGSYLHMNDFNKQFFRLARGLNEINLVGDISELTIYAEFAKGIGA